MIRRVLRANPVTLTVVLALVVLTIVNLHSRAASVPRVAPLSAGYSVVIEHGRWWTILTAALVSRDLAELAPVVLLVIVLLGASERVLGLVRTIIAFVVTAALGTIAGIVIQAIGVSAHEIWSMTTSRMPVTDALTPLFGTVMTASAFMSQLWRRRVRVIVLSAALVFLLYSGEPGDLYRVLASVAGLGLGWALHPSDASPLWPRSSHHETRVLVSATVALSAIGPAVTLLGRTRLGPLAPLGLLLINGSMRSRAAGYLCSVHVTTHGCLNEIALRRINGPGAVILTLMPLVTLLIAALGILWGRRFGAWLAIVVNLALAGLAILYYGVLPLFPTTRPGQIPSISKWERPLDFAVCTLVPLVISIVVAVNLRHFTVRASARLVRLYLVGAGATLIGASALYVGVGMALRSEFHPVPGFIDLIEDLPDRFAPVGFLKREPLAFHPVGFGAHFVYDWVGAAFWFAVAIGALVVIVRPSQTMFSERARAIALLHSAGGGSLSYWATWQGNRYWFSTDGRACVAYRVSAGVAVTVSEPFGYPESVIEAVPEFARYCDDNGWTPFFYGVHTDVADACTSIGWTAEVIGDETIIHPTDWDTTGKKWQDVRTSINRAQREGLSARMTRFSDLTALQRNQIQEISEVWVAEKGLPEMGFTLGGIDELRDDEVRMMVALDSADQVVGVTSWLPTYRLGRVVGWTLDFMRRTPGGPNGVMEFLIARAAEHFRDDGIEQMSLSTAPLARNLDEVAETRTVARLLTYIGTLLEPVYGFRSLLNFKRKFQPSFTAVYMAYPDSAALPSIALALSRSYIPSMSVRQSLEFVRSLGRRR